MKHLLYIILLSLSFLSACMPRAEQKQREANDTIIDRKSTRLNPVTRIV